MRRTLLSTITAALLAVLVLVAPSASARTLSVNLQSIRGDVAVIKTVCPVDPPSTVFVVGTVNGTQTLLGSQPITCTGKAQTVRLPLTPSFPRGTVITDVQVTVSGDSGEINQFIDRVVTR